MCINTCPLPSQLMLYFQLQQRKRSSQSQSQGGTSMVDRRRRDAVSEHLRLVGFITILIASAGLLDPPATSSCKGGDQVVPLLHLPLLLLLFGGCAVLFASLSSPSQRWLWFFAGGGRNAASDQINQN